MSYDLTKDIQEYFEFNIDEHRYKMRYPTTEEALEAEKLREDPLKAGEWVQKFITPISDNAPDITELLNKSNVRVLRNFTNMIKAEFSAT